MGDECYQQIATVAFCSRDEVVGIRGNAPEFRGGGRSRVRRHARWLKFVPLNSVRCDFRPVAKPSDNGGVVFLRFWTFLGFEGKPDF